MTTNFSAQKTDSVRRRWMRWAGAALVSVMLVTAAGCSNNNAKSETSPSPSPSASPTPSNSANMLSSLDDVHVTGGFGADPTVTANWPVGVADTMSKVLVSGNGAEVPSGGSVEVNYSGVNGRTGKVFDSSFTRGQTAVFGLDQVVPGFSKGLTGKHVGDRVLIGVASKDGYDSSGGSQSADIQVGDTLFFVVDLVATQLSQPSGTSVNPPSGSPTVTGDINNPSIHVPGGNAPSDLVVQPLIKGSGKAVAAGDTVTVNYMAVDWNGGRTVQSTFNNGKPAPQTGALSSLIQGWQKGLVGQPVGSRVLLTVPASLAYPSGSTNPSIAPNTTLVYIVDVLFTQAGQGS